mmetsp:Transcript_36811/g.113868  ORF Transcript_36811/g.113868 Transcript_36811/m.113868 type:complete len:1052 (-) Transcript_36811:136-3291(-)
MSHAARRRRRTSFPPDGSRGADGHYGGLEAVREWQHGADHAGHFMARLAAGGTMQQPERDADEVKLRLEAYVREALGRPDARVAAPALNAFADAAAAEPNPGVYFAIAFRPTDSRTIQLVESLTSRDAASEEFGNFCALLGTMLREELRPQFASGLPPRTADVPQLARYALGAARKMPLHRLLYALATGRYEMPAGFENAAAQRTGLGVTAAMDIVSSLATSRVMPTQELVAALMHDSAVPTRVRSIIARLAVSASRTTVVDRRQQDVVSRGDPTRGIPRSSLVIQLFDNIGFKKAKTYEQFVVMCYMEVPYDRLVELGVIDLSNETRSLEDELSTAQTYLPGNDELLALRQRVATRLRTLVHLYPSAGDLAFEPYQPDESEGVDAVDDAAADEDDDDDEAADAEAVDAAADDAVADDDEDVTAVGMDLATGLLDLQQSRIQDGKFTRQAGSMIMDTPLHKNLGEKSTVLAVLSRAAQVAKTGQFKPADDDDDRRDHGLGVCTVCDGSPAIMAQDLFREHGTALGPVTLGDGGFHMEKEVWTALGKLFDAVFLRYLTKRIGRRSKEAQNWVLEPGNPDQARAEFRQALMGMQYAAVEETRRALDRRDVSPAEVHSRMTRRAAREPMVFAVFLWMQFVEVALMIHDSKHVGARGDYSLYRHGRSLAQLLFAGSNCKGYVSLVTNSIETWATASDRKRWVLAELMFTMKSSTGRGLAHADQFVEWLNRDIRSILGKHMIEGREKHIMRTIQDLPWLIGALRESLLRSFDDATEAAPEPAPTEPNTTAAGAPRPLDTCDPKSPAFLAARHFCREHDIWGDGPLRRKSRQLAPGAFVCLETGKPLNPEFLLVLERARDRMATFLDERRGGDFEAGTTAAVTVSNRRFAAPTALASDVAARAEWEAARRTSVSSHKMMSKFDGVIGKGDNFVTVGWATAECEAWRAAGRVVPTRLPTKKLVLIELLCEIRREAFAARFQPRETVPVPSVVASNLSSDADGTFRVDGVAPSDPLMLFDGLGGVADAETRPPLPSPPTPAPAPGNDDEDDCCTECVVS